MRIALFITCIGDTMFPEAGRATVDVLERLGHEVVFPEAQTCCGQMHANSGYHREARRLARRFVEIFGEQELVVAPSSSCVGAVRELYPQLLGVSHPVTERVFELSELLVHRLGVEDVDGRPPRLGEHEIADTGDEERNPHGATSESNLRTSCRVERVIATPQKIVCVGLNYRDHAE